MGRLALNRERVGEGIPVHFSFDSFGVSEIILIFSFALLECFRECGWRDF